MSELENVIRQIAEPFVKSLGLEIWGIEISQFHKTAIRLYVDTPYSACSDSSSHEHEGISLEISSDTAVQENVENQADPHSPIIPLSVSVDKCARISRHIGLILEVEDIITEAYVLEVSSPGLSRQFFKLNQLHSYVGDRIEVVLREGHEEWENRKKFTGFLGKVTDTGICIHLEDLNASKQIKKSKGNLSAVADTVTQTVAIEWEDIRTIKRMHIFNVSNVVNKKKKSEQ